MTDIDFLLNYSFEKTKVLAREYYFKSLNGRAIKVLALKGEKVHFTREGWEHLLQEKRSTHELLTRLFTLTRVSIVLKKATKVASQTSRTVENKNFKLIEYWAFEEIVEGVLVKVVVASYESGPKFFLSAVWKGTKKELSLACNPRRRRMVTSQLLDKKSVSQIKNLSTPK